MTEPSVTPHGLDRQPHAGFHIASRAQRDDNDDLVLGVEEQLRTQNAHVPDHIGVAQEQREDVGKPEAHDPAPIADHTLKAVEGLGKVLEGLDSNQASLHQRLGELQQVVGVAGHTAPSPVGSEGGRVGKVSAPNPDRAERGRGMFGLGAEREVATLHVQALNLFFAARTSGKNRGNRGSCPLPY